MKLSLNSIIYKLNEFSPVPLMETKNLSKVYDGIKQYYEADPGLSDDQLYITRASLLIELGMQVDKHLTFICINDSFSNAEALMKLCNRIILIDGTFLLECVFNRILEIFEKFRNWDKNMHMAMLGGAKPQEMISLSEDIICLPMIIFDPSFNVLAYTKNIESDYEFYNETITNGYTKSEIIIKLKKERIFNDFDRKGDFLIHRAFGSHNRNNIYVRIRSKGVLLGYACILEASKTVASGYVDIVNYFLDNLRLYFAQDNNNVRYSNFMYENFLSTIIQNAAISEEQLTEQLKYIEGITWHGPFALLMFEFSDQENVPLPFIARELKSIFNGGYPFVFNGIMYLLLQRTEFGLDKLFTDMEKDRLHDAFADYGYRCYISKSFYDIREMAIANFLCEKTRKLAAEQRDVTRHLFFCDDYQWEHLMSIWSVHLPLELLFKEEYIKLKKYCEINKNNYMKILFTYLKCHNHATKTGEVLYMHRNTILYTIKRIEELLLVNFDDFTISHSFLLSFLIDEYLNS